MGISPDEAVAFIAFIVFIFWEPFRASVKEWSTYYKAQSKERIKFCKFPPATFGVVWFIIKTLLVFVGYYAFGPSPIVQIDPDYRLAVYILWVTNEMLRKYWSVAFMDFRANFAALVIHALLLATGGTVLGFFAASQAWLAFGLYACYIAWSFIAFFLTFQWWYNDPARKIKRTLI